LLTRANDSAIANRKHSLVCLRRRLRIGLLAMVSRHHLESRIWLGSRSVSAGDTRVLAVTAGVSFLTALFFGMIPALHATRVNLNDTLTNAVPNALRGSQSRTTRNLLVVFQCILGWCYSSALACCFAVFATWSLDQWIRTRACPDATLKLPPSRYTDIRSSATDPRSPSSAPD